MKPLALDLSVNALCKQYPELADILAELGFSDILKPGMMQSRPSHPIDVGLRPTPRR